MLSIFVTCFFLAVLGLSSEKAMAPQSSTLAWKIQWMEEPGTLRSMGSLRVGHNRTTSLSFFTFMHWRRKWQPTPVFLPGESKGQWSLVGCHLWGFTETDTTEATQQQDLVAAHGTFVLPCGTWDLVPWPGMETGPPALGMQSLSHQTTREVPCDLFLSGIVSRPRFTKSSHLGVTFAPVSWCLMLLGFGVCPK